MQSRGYKEAEVLKYIAQHLLDSKEYVLPQAGRADLVVRYGLPAPDAPDEEIGVSMLLRRRAADLARSTDLLAGLSPSTGQSESAGEVRIELGSRLMHEMRQSYDEVLTPIDPAATPLEEVIAGTVDRFIEFNCRHPAFFAR